MRLFEYTLLLDDIVVDQGYLTATNEDAAEQRLMTEKASKKLYTAYFIKERFCEECGGDDDVVYYLHKKKEHIKCRDCRFKMAR